MILDSLSHSERYNSLGSRVATGLKWLQAFKPETADGRYEIEGDDVYALVQSYDTLPAAEKKFEAHRIYADIQYVVLGNEQIHYNPIDQLQPSTTYDAVKDYLLFADAPATTPLLLGPGSFAIFYPNDGHKPGCADGKACRIKKVVIKFRV